MTRGVPRHWIAALAVFAVAAALRGAVASTGNPTVAEALGAGRGMLLPSDDVGVLRAIGVLLGAAAAALVFLAAARSFGGVAALATGVLAACDPLGVVAAAEAGPGGALALAGAALVLLALPAAGLAGEGGVQTSGSRSRWRWTVAALLLGAIGFALAWPADARAIDALPADPVFGAWQMLGGDVASRVGAFVHHAGYALVPLALVAFSMRGGRRVGLVALLMVVAACLIERGLPARLAAFAGVTPAFVAAAGVALARIAAVPGVTVAAPSAFAAARSATVARATSAASRAANWRIAGIACVVLAVHAPVLASDLLRGGPRFPWRAALARLAAEAPGVPLVSTTPAPAAYLLGIHVAPLARSRGALDDLLASRDAALLLPIEGGELYGATDPSLLAAIEECAIADISVRSGRFDLYRFEIRLFLPRRP